MDLPLDYVLCRHEKHHCIWHIRWGKIFEEASRAQMWGRKLEPAHCHICQIYHSGTTNMKLTMGSYFLCWHLRVVYCSGDIEVEMVYVVTLIGPKTTSFVSDRWTEFHGGWGSGFGGLQWMRYLHNLDRDVLRFRFATRIVNFFDVFSDDFFEIWVVAQVMGTVASERFEWLHGFNALYCIRLQCVWTWTHCHRSISQCSLYS